MQLLKVRHVTAYNWKQLESTCNVLIVFIIVIDVTKATQHPIVWLSMTKWLLYIHIALKIIYYI